MITVIYGPHASGKTRHREALATHFGCTRILDCEIPLERSTCKAVTALQAGDLVLTNDEGQAQRLGEIGARVIYIGDALAQAGIQH